MIRILVKDSQLYEFNDGTMASLWVKNFPQLYDNNIKNITVLSDKHIPNMLEIIKHSKREVISCKGCSSTLGFEVEPDDQSFIVICPSCSAKNPFII